MRERLRLEKEKKNSAKEVDNSKDNGAKQKRKQTEDGADSQKKKKKTQKQTEGDKEKDQKTKEKEEKKKKKDEEQQRQKCLLEARKAQAASRWASTSTDIQADQEITIFTPEPVRQTIIRPCQSLIDLTPPAQQTLHPTTGSQNTEQLTTPLQPTSTDRNQTARDRHTGPPRSQSKDKTPAGPTNSKRTSAPRRGLHFQSAVAESSDDEIDEDIEDNGEQIDIISDHGSSDCCKEKKLEIEALRKRLEKVHKRLNIACKFS